MIMFFTSCLQIKTDQYCLLFSDKKKPVWKVLASRSKKLFSRKFRKPRQRRQGQHRLKNEFIFYIRVLQYSKVIYFVFYHCQNYHETLAAVVHVLQSTQNSVISRCQRVQITTTATATGTSLNKRFKDVRAKIFQSIEFF